MDKYCLFTQNKTIEKKNISIYNTNNISIRDVICIFSYKEFYSKKFLKSIFFNSYKTFQLKKNKEISS